MLRDEAQCPPGGAIVGFLLIAEAVGFCVQKDDLASCSGSLLVLGAFVDE